MSYRVAISNIGNLILDVAEDTDQGDEDYKGIGKWADWTFPVLPVRLEDMTNSDVIVLDEDGKGFIITSLLFG